MSSSIVNNDGLGEPTEVEKRLEDRYRRLCTRDPICAWPDCGETNVFALVGSSPDISCYEHYSLRTGHKPYEAHHLAGQHNSEALTDVPGNEHRILSELQRVWPEDTLRNPEHSPLLAAAAAIRGWCDVLMVIIYRSVGWIPGFLEWLNNVLVDQIGTEWWIDSGWTGTSHA